MKMRISNHLRKKRLLIILAILLILILAIILLLGRKKLKDTGIPSDEMWSEPVSYTSSDGISHFDGQQYQYEECWDSKYYDRDIGWLIMPMNSMADAEADLGYSIIVPDAVEGYDPPQIYVEDNDLFGIDENEPEGIVSNRELLIVRYRVPDMELETREDYVMEGGGQNWHTYYNYLQVIKKAGEEPVDHYFEHSVYDEKSQLEMEAYSPELTCVTGEEPSTFAVECHGREGLISFAEWQHDGFAYAISTQYKPLSEEEMKELIYQIW